MGKTADRPRRGRAAAPPQDFADSVAWTRVLSLTGALLSHLASNPETQRLMQQMLAAGVPLPPDLLTSAAPFDEALVGLQTRELSEPDVFRRFFGGRVVPR